MLREIRDLGFEYAELSHGVRISLLPGILEAVDAGEIKISSLHNFCPLPMGVNNAAPNLYQFSADRPRERELAVRYTVKTIELAARVKASVVVLHLGSMEMKNFTDRLLEMVARGHKETEKYQRLCEEVDEKREKKKTSPMQHLTEVLKHLVTEAESRNITLGAENRQALEELPLDSDFEFLFRELNSARLAYWHDTGHAQIKENLGFSFQRMQLESLRDRVCGFHIHDVQFPGRDHCAPGTGTIDFAALKPFVKAGHLKVFEFGPGLKPEEVKAGAEHIKRLWDAG